MKRTKPERSQAVERLQDLLIDKMIEALGDSPTAADISNVIKFLKDNGFSVDPIKDQDDALSRLLDAAGVKRATLPTIGENPPN